MPLRRLRSKAYTPYATLVRETIQQILDNRGWTQQDAVRAWGVKQATLSDALGAKHAGGASLIAPILEAEGWDPILFFLQHPRLAEIHLDSGSALHEEFDNFTRMIGGGENLRRFVDLGVRAAKLGIRDEMAAVVREALGMAEKVAEGRPRSSPGRK